MSKAMCSEPNTGTLGSFLVILVRLVQSLLLVHQLPFGTLRIGSVFSTLGIIRSEFWYIWCTLVHLTFGTPVGTCFLLVHEVAFWHTGIVRRHLRHVLYSRYVSYTSCVWHTNDGISVQYTMHHS